jgi:hypothetical protein
MSANRGYKVRSYINGKKSPKGSQYINYSLTVPIEIAEAIPDGMQFIPRMCDEGLLYEPVQQAHKPLPAWAEQNGTRGKSRQQST